MGRSSVLGAAAALMLLPSMLLCQFPDGPETPQVPDTLEGVTKTLCSNVKRWRIRLTTLEVTQTPGDGPGSKEEWRVNFILFGGGPLSSSFDAETFDVFPSDNIDSVAEIDIFTAGDELEGVGALVLTNDRAEDRVVLGGKELDPFDDDKLPSAEITFRNPCHVSVAGALTQALTVTDEGKASGHGRRFSFRISATPVF